MFLVNPKSKQPIYEQLVEQLRRQLFLGVVKAGQALPSVAAGHRPGHQSQHHSEGVSPHGSRRDDHFSAGKGQLYQR